MSQFDSSYFMSMLPSNQQQTQNPYTAQYGQLRSFQPNMNMGYGNVNIPGLGQAGNSLLSILPMMLAPMFQQRGFTMGSLLGPMNSYRESEQARKEFNELMQAEGVARQQNESIIAARMRAMDAMTGGSAPGRNAQNDAYYAQMAQKYNTFVQYASPFVGMLDQFLGTDMLGVLAPTRNVGVNISNASRGFYRGSGIFGLNPETANEMTRDFIENFKVAQGKSGAGEIDYDRTKGLSMNTVSQAVISLQNRGLLNNYVTAEGAKESEGAMRESLGTEGQGISLDQIRSKYNTKQVAKNTEAYLGVLALAKEITGSKDAEELMKAVQALSGGAAGQLDPQRIQQMIAQTREIARTARMSMDVMSSLINEGAQMAKSMGMSGVMGARLATQNVLMAQVATSAIGNLPGQPTAYAGKVNFEGVYQTGQQLAVMGANSSVMSQIYAAMHMTGQLAGGVDNLYTTDKNGVKSVNESAVTNPLLRDILKAGLSGDPKEAERLANMLRGSEGQRALAQAISDQSGGKISFQSAYGGIFDKNFSNLGQTEFDLTDFTRSAQKNELVTQLTNRMSIMEDQKKIWQDMGLDTSKKGLRDLAEAGIAPSQYEAQINVAKLMAQKAGKKFEDLTRDEQKSLIEKARPVVVSLQQNEDTVLMQQRILPQNRNEVNAVFSVDAKMREAKENIRLMGAAAEKTLGLGASELPGRISAAVRELLGGKQGAGLDALMEVIGFIPNEKIRDRMQDNLLEARRLSKDIADAKSGKQVAGLETQEKILEAEGKLNRLTNQLSSVPGELTRRPGDRMKDFQNAANAMEEKLKKGGYKTEAEQKDAKDRISSLYKVIKKGKFDPEKDQAAFFAYLEQQDEADRDTQAEKLKEHRETTDKRRKMYTERRDQAAARLKKDPNNQNAKEAYEMWEGKIKNLDKPETASDSKNQKGADAVAKVEDDKPRKVEVINLPKENKVSGTLALTMESGTMKAMLDMIQKESTRTS
jgi:hypothetical protein